ncbi:FAD-dependent oxidoreductase domain-containing protein 2 [Nymphon striatum]|nr:FAD-dependent oxidoreductase domain-containing protein 2 [Nymphon striatum]
MYLYICLIFIYTIPSRKTETAQYFEDFPIKMFAEFSELTGVDITSKSFLVMDFEYGRNFSGPGKDTFAEDRAVGDASEAHKSNFLHPVFYYYKTLPTGNDMKNMVAKEVLTQAKFHAPHGRRLFDRLYSTYNASHSFEKIFRTHFAN